MDVIPVWAWFAAGLLLGGFLNKLLDVIAAPGNRLATRLETRVDTLEKDLNKCKEQHLKCEKDFSRLEGIVSQLQKTVGNSLVAHITVNEGESHILKDIEAERIDDGANS